MVGAAAAWVGGVLDWSEVEVIEGVGVVGDELVDAGDASESDIFLDLNPNLLLPFRNLLFAATGGVGKEGDWTDIGVVGPVSSSALTWSEVLSPLVARRNIGV